RAAGGSSGDPAGGTERADGAAVRLRPSQPHRHHHAGGPGARGARQMGVLPRRRPPRRGRRIRGAGESRLPGFAELKSKSPEAAPVAAVRAIFSQGAGSSDPGLTPRIGRALSVSVLPFLYAPSG